jgi:UDP-3-O-[3-hydroxymyristoyl] glucosamine N-acyltransferase
MLTNQLIQNCKIHDTAKLSSFINIYGCSIEENVFIGPFVEIQKNVFINRGSRVSSHSFICEGVTIGENCFIGHGVMFTNDKFDSPDLKSWIKRSTYVGNNVRIGGKSGVIADIKDNQIVMGYPAKSIRDFLTNKK